MKTVVDNSKDLEPLVSKPLGTSRWVELDAARLLEFGRLTGDTHWIHTDAARVQRETPYGGPLVHGYLLLSLLTDLGNECLEVRQATRWLNYGLDRVRFTAPVVAGSRVRLVQTLVAVDLAKPNTARITVGCTIECEGSERPAMVGERIMVALW